MEYDIESILKMYEDDYNPDPRPMNQGPRNMYNQGQLVSNTVDGSRPGYSGDNVEPNIAKSPAGNFQVTYKEKHLGTFKSIEEAREIRDTAKKDSPRIKGQGKKLQPGSQSAKIRTILDSYIAEGKNTYTFKEIIKSADITSKKEESKFRKTLEGLLKRKEGKEKYSNLKMISSNLLNEEDRLKVISNFDLPEGQTKWDFDKHKYGTKNELLTKRIIGNLKTNKSVPLAASFGNAKGWMMNSMYRVFQNQTKNDIALTYEPITGKVASGETKIIGFKDNTPSGKGGNFYGLDKYTKEDATDWNDHDDYEKVKKMVKITSGVRQAPSDVLQKLLTKKGITAKLRLNDILSHDRYYTKLSEVSPTALIRTQIVKHHSGGVGAKGNLNAAATKDIQLLTGANNATVTNYENIVNGTEKKIARALTADENKILKNMGAKITGLDGKVYGGGSLNPDKQFALIEKQAAEMIKGENFTPKKIVSYLERLGCGKAAGGRINMRTGGLTDCAIAGQKKITKGLAVGFKEGEGALAQKILQAGKGLKNMVALRSLLGPAALGFTVAAEAGIVGYDMLATGKSFKDVVGNSLFNNLLGDKTKIDTDEIRYKNYERLGINTDQIKKFEEGLGEINQMAQVYNDAENSNYKMLMGQTTSNPRVSQAMRDRSNKALILKNEKNQQAATDLTTELSNPEKQKSLNEFAENTDLNRNLIASADQRVAADEIQKPSTANFRSGMQTIFPRSNYDSETDKIINYEPVMQDYYRTNQYSAGGIADLMKKKND